MLLADGALGLVLVGLWIFCVIDVVTTDEAAVRNLPKLAWVFLVLLVPDIGSIAWLVAGRPWQDRSRRAATPGARWAEYDRPGRHVPANPDDDEDFLRQVRERAEAQRRRHEAARRAERQAEQDRLTKRPPEDG